MPFPLHFQCSNTALCQMQLDQGEMLFVLGANGVGKSSLMHRFAQQNRNNVRKISAHRQTWMASDTLDMTPANKVQTEKHIENEEQQPQSRHKDSYAAQRASMIIYEMIDAENVRARKIAAEVDANRMEGARAHANSEAPIKVINELLQLSNIPIEISIQANERVMASKDGGPVYSAAELSDGERNALLIAGAVLTAPPDTLIIIDEPERHLHRSIISPLLTQLFERRQDCAFVVSTHDHDLPVENPASRTLLVRSCSFTGRNTQSWEADELAGNDSIDDVLKRDLLGARRKILFVEGTESSLDKPLYSLIFPQVSIIAKGSCREVEHAVQGLNVGEEFHWLRAFGIVDRDGFDDAAVAEKMESGVYALSYYSVEAIYFHPKVIEMIAAKQAGVSGDDASQLTIAAIKAGVKEVSEHAERLCEKAVKKAIGKAILEQLPDGDDYLNGVETHIVVDSKTLLAERTAQLTGALKSDNWEAVITSCPIRECGARDQIARSLNFRKIADYQRAVQHMLSVDAEALDYVRSLFSNLYAKIAD